jgi:uncharacterized protein (TIGR02266 family)
MNTSWLVGKKVTLSNKRISPRMPTMLKVEYSTTGGDILYDYSTNISTTGLFLHSSQPLAKGSHIHLRLTLPGAPRPLHIMGEVMWVHRGGGKNPALPGVGIRFRFISEEHKQALIEFLKEFGEE